MTPQTRPPRTPQLHLCDFDGTLTRGDSLWQFLLFTQSKPQLFWGGIQTFFQFLKLLLAGKWSNSTAKQALLASFFQGQSQASLQHLGQQFATEKIPASLRIELMESLQQAVKNGDTVVVVSASLDLWLRPFCRSNGFELLCTELEFVDGVFVGRFATPNCNGIAKAHRIKEVYRLVDYSKILAYGNSKGDDAMFELAEEIFRF